MKKNANWDSATSKLTITSSLANPLPRKRTPTRFLLPTFVNTHSQSKLNSV